jgi:hypothetical protein
MHFAVCGAALSTAARGILRRSARCCGADRTGGGAVLRGGRGVPAGLDRHCGATSATAGTAGPAQRMERAVVERAAISGGLGQRGGGRQRRGARGRRRIERRRGLLEGEDLQDVVQVALAADGAQARVAGLLGEEGVHVGDVRRLGVGEAEAFAAAGEVLPAAAAAEQAVVADAMEARRQDVLEEAVDEVGAGQRHALLGLGGVRVLDAVVAVAEGDPAAVDRLDAVVGDGDAVDVAAQVADQRLGVGEGGLDVDHPVLLVELLHQALPGGIVVEVGLVGRPVGVATEVEPPGLAGARLVEVEGTALGRAALGAERLEVLEEHGAEDPPQSAVGEEEVLRRRHEAAAVALEAAAGDDAVDVRVQVHGLAPGVQNGDDAEVGVPLLAGEGLEGLGGGAHEGGIDLGGMVAGQGMEQVGQGEDDVEVLDGQQLQLAGVDPCGALGGPTLGTVAVAATVVADLEVPALVALIDVGTERGGAADLDGVQGAALLEARGVGGAVVVAVEADDVGQLEFGLGVFEGEFPADLGADGEVGTGVGEGAGHADSIAGPVPSRTVPASRRGCRGIRPVLRAPPRPCPRHAVYLFSPTSPAACGQLRPER